jgi:hypothetical protein
MNKVVFLIIICEIILVIFLTYKVLRIKKDTKKVTTNSEIISSLIDSESVFNEKHVVHPYLGFVNEYISNPYVNEFGFHGSPPLLKKQENSIIIGVFGGSVAELLCDHEVDYFIQKLKIYPYFENKKINIVCIAQAGFKQPQQLFALNYFLILGGQFDIIINLDGFNEVALPWAENIPNHVSTFFPRSWNIYSRNTFNLDEILLLASIKKNKNVISQLDHLFSLPILNNFKLLYKFFYMIEQNKINLEEKELSELLVKSEKSYQTTGPESEFFKKTGAKDNIVKVWKESSIQMSKLAKSNSILYLHFLQPNQYFTDSKPLNNEEKQTAYMINHPYKNPVQIFYPKLIEAGGDLKKEGIIFNDLTMIFRNNNDTIYSDNCCHLNKKGDEILVNSIIKTIINNYK